MLFPDTDLSECILPDLAKEITESAAPEIYPLPCDRWVARSALQKGIRRGEVEVAQRALGNLFDHDRRAAWRHIAIIAIEDVGVANIDVVARIVAAYRDRKWRQQVGGDWRVMAELVRQMATSDHCQAACDLLLRALNDPRHEDRRTVMLEADIANVAAVLWDCSEAIKHRAIAALAMGGGLVDGQRYNDPSAVFDILGETGWSTDVVGICRAGWKLTRNPMALLLPLIWKKWSPTNSWKIATDRFPPVQMLGSTPGYALDQFTRVGNAISRALLKADPDLRQMLNEAGVVSGSQPKAVGDLFFLSEGGLLINRICWTTGDMLRLPHRQLGSIASIGTGLPRVLAHLQSKARQISLLRRQHFYSYEP